MSTKILIGVMGPGEGATPEENEVAYALGAAIAREGWVTLTGGRSFGVMEAALKGASDNNGLTIGVLPGDTAAGTSPFAQIKIVTGMGSARNNINVLSSHAVIVLGMAAGTSSEVALGIKANKKIILLSQDDLTIQFFRKIGTYKISTATSVNEAIAIIQDYVGLNQIQ